MVRCIVVKIAIKIAKLYGFVILLTLFNPIDSRIKKKCKIVVRSQQNHMKSLENRRFLHDCEGF